MLTRLCYNRLIYHNKIMKNEELWSYMSLESKKYVETRFSPADIISKYREILNYVI